MQQDAKSPVISTQASRVKTCCATMWSDLSLEALENVARQALTLTLALLPPPSPTLPLLLLLTFPPPPSSSPLLLITRPPSSSCAPRSAFVIVLLLHLFLFSPSIFQPSHHPACGNCSPLLHPPLSSSFFSFYSPLSSSSFTSCSLHLLPSPPFTFPPFSSFPPPLRLVWVCGNFSDTLSTL